MVAFSIPKLDEKNRRLLSSYAVDWFTSIALSATFYCLERIPGFKRQFSLEDKTIQFPYASHERVPDWALTIVCFVAPMSLLLAVNYLTLRSKWDCHVSVLGLVVSLSLTAVVTEVTKITVGRPRPDLISRCVPKPGSTDPIWGLSTFEVCTAQSDTFQFHDGWRSFPSGHSSLSFAGLGFLSFYLAGKLQLFNRKAYTVKVWLVLTPLVGATLVAVSRTMDYRHHWHDVLAGSALGLVLSYLTYRQYFPPLQSHECDEPYPSRVRLEQTILPTHSDDQSLEVYRPNGAGYGHAPYHDTEEET
ncbi:phosphatidic acid phosphatase type 2/haloperoxidase [Cytidiella melzeri]|nr:phosphatidic acid phosphatase type 2/haloperoxidase [Cytidiella melzeri]